MLFFPSPHHSFDGAIPLFDREKSFSEKSERKKIVDTQLKRSKSGHAGLSHRSNWKFTCLLLRRIRRKARKSGWKTLESRERHKKYQAEQDLDLTSSAQIKCDTEYRNRTGDPRGERRVHTLDFTQRIPCFIRNREEDSLYGFLNIEPTTSLVAFVSDFLRDS